MKKTNKFPPIKLHIDNPERVFDEYRNELSITIIRAIDYAIKHKKKRVDFANIIVKSFLVITLTIDSREFLDLIDENLKHLIEIEEYEMCALAVILKEKLTKTIIDSEPIEMK